MFRLILMCAALAMLSLGCGDEDESSSADARGDSSSSSGELDTGSSGDASSSSSGMDASSGGDQTMGDTGDAPEEIREPATLRMFLTEGDYAADMNGIGIAVADGICNSETIAPEGATFKALLGSATRVPCGAPNCEGASAGQQDWVLQPNTRYTRLDGTLVMLTSDAGIAPLPLEAALGVEIEFWSGLSADWTVANDLTCGDWLSTDGEGRVGSGSASDATFLDNGVLLCTNHRPLLCVEQ